MAFAVSYRKYSDFTTSINKFTKYEAVLLIVPVIKILTSQIAK
ncbi:hypothetical protein BH23BAC2_BH23BAC2_25150 [soil metagenome]